MVCVTAMMIFVVASDFSRPGLLGRHGSLHAVMTRVPRPVRRIRRIRRNDFIRNRVGDCRAPTLEPRQTPRRLTIEQRRGQIGRYRQNGDERRESGGEMSHGPEDTTFAAMIGQGGCRKLFGLRINRSYGRRFSRGLNPHARDLGADVIEQGATNELPGERKVR
jgi:hypothetical protein